MGRASYRACPWRREAERDGVQVVWELWGLMAASDPTEQGRAGEGAEDGSLVSGMSSRVNPGTFC